MIHEHNNEIPSMISPIYEQPVNGGRNENYVDSEMITSGLEQLLRYSNSSQTYEEQKVMFITNMNEGDGNIQMGDYKNVYYMNDYNSNSNQTTENSVMTEVTSDTSTNTNDNDTNKEEDILPAEDAFTYLQGLNSDNLMQFSQQSTLQEMMLKEHFEAKPNLNVLPTFEEHDIGGYKFNLNVSSKRKGKVSWVYSEKLNKIYIRMNDICSIDAVYKPKLPLQPLRIRVLMCFVKEVSEPVLRCQNHISKDTEQHQKKRHSLLRCENPFVEYCGTAEGKSINDRYSIKVPLSENVMPKEDCTVTQTIALKFTCQNSCIGRKETSIIFLLEGMNGEILSQRVLDVKICSCPKRDYEAEEKHTKEAPKRKSSEHIFTRENKIQKKQINTAVAVKEERSSDFEDIGHNSENVKKFDIQRTPSGSYRLVMEMCSKELAMKTIDYACSSVASKIVGESGNSVALNKNYRKLKKLYEKGHKL